MPAIKPLLALAMAGALGLAGCADTGPNQQVGATAGAILGGLIGATRPGGNAGTAAVGAVIGGVAGGAIGTALDKQAGDLRSGLHSDGIEVVNTGSALIVTMPNDLLFDSGSASIRPALNADLQALAANLNAYPDSTIQVVGHTDNVGSATSNLDLSRRRAAAVAGVLTLNGLAPGRVSTLGRGEDAPVASNLTPEGRQQNRRVEIYIYPSAG